jgi:hypothetical protein
MSDDLLSVLGRNQREDLEREDEGASEHDALERPFDEEERASILDAVFDQLDHSSAAPEMVAPVAEQPAASNVVPLRARRGALAGGLLTLAAAAAAAVVWWSWPGGEPEQLAMVPAYTFTKLGGGVSEVRSDRSPATDVAVPELRLRPNSSVDWWLTPEQPIRGPIGVALLARSDTGSTQFVPHLNVEVSEQGAVRVRGRLDEHVALAPGNWTVTLFIAAPEQLPGSAEAADDDPARWRSLSLRATIVADE